MTPSRVVALAALSVAALLGCGGSSGAKGAPMVADPTNDVADAIPGEGDGGLPAPPPSDTPPSGAATLQGTEEGAQRLLEQFVAPDADHAALTRSLRPTPADYKALFDAPTAAKIEAVQSKEWDSGKAVIKPKPSQTEVKIWSATGADLASGKGSAKEFPAGYKKLGKHLSTSVTFFRFKFVEAGKDVGTAYDGLAFVNGHWVIAPKPWKAAESKPGPDDEKASAPKDGAEEAPKPKPKRRKKK